MLMYYFTYRVNSANSLDDQRVTFSNYVLPLSVTKQFGCPHVESEAFLKGVHKTMRLKMDRTAIQRRASGVRSHAAYELLKVLFTRRFY